MDPIYQTLRKRGLTSGLADFSTHYAARSPSYLATTKTLSADAMVAVFQRLMEEGHWLLAFRVARRLLFAQPVRESRHEA